MGTTRLALGALVVGLCLAAATAVAALLGGDFGDAHARVIGTSVGFGVLSALGASGAGLWRARDGWRAALGAATALAALAAFAALVVVIWIETDGDATVRACALAALLALWGSHASLVLGAQRGDDTPLVGAIVWISVLAAAVDALVAGALIVGLVDDVDEAAARAVGAVVVVTVLTTALPPLLRRLAASARGGAADPFGRPPRARDGRRGRAAIADELSAVAARLEAAGTPAEARSEAAVLRELAERARR